MCIMRLYMCVYSAYYLKLNRYLVIVTGKVLQHGKTNPNIKKSIETLPIRERESSNSQKFSVILNINICVVYFVPYIWNRYPIENLKIN